MTRHLMLILPALLVMGVTIASCTSTSPDGAERTRVRQHGPITYQEIERAQIQTNAYEVVRRLRPNWLHDRGPSFSRTDIPVYVDNVIRYGATDQALSSIHVSEIASIEFLTAQRAQNRRGMGNQRGAFFVALRRGP